MVSSLFDSKKNCCGCEACVNICPKSLISMKQDEEGFFYPIIESNEGCISCDSCEKVCPTKNVKRVECFAETAYAGYIDNESELLLCSSGGLATAISKAFIRKYHGIVFGVRYSTGFETSEYAFAENEDELEQFKGSKYSQSRKNDVYRNVQLQLNSGKRVLFIGLPCDVYAVYRYCKKHDNLYTCTLVCHGVTSPSVLTEYISSVKGLNDSITAFSLRNKKVGWKPYYIFSEINGKEKRFEQFSTSTFGNAFLYLKRPSCNVCRIKRDTIHSDVTLGDFHNIVANDKFYNKNGVSSAIVHTEKGKELLSIVENVRLEQVDISKAAKNRGYYEAIPEKKNRDEYGKVFSTQGLMAASSLKSCKKIEKQDKIKAKVMVFLVKVRSILRKIKK